MWASGFQLNLLSSGYTVSLNSNGSGMIVMSNPVGRAEAKYFKMTFFLIHVNHLVKCVTLCNFYLGKLLVLLNQPSKAK